MFHLRVYANHSSHVTKSRLAQKGKAYDCDVRFNIGNRLTHEGFHLLLFFINHKIPSCKGKTSLY